MEDIIKDVMDSIEAFDHDKSTEYIIIGDTENFKDCLIYTGCRSKEDAERVIDRILHNPTKNDLYVAKGHTNLRYKKVDPKECWWHDPFLCN